MKIQRPARVPTNTANRPKTAVKPSKNPAAATLTPTNAWLMNHWQALWSSFWQLLRAPLANLMTIAVVAVALALPAGFYLLLENVHLVSAQWTGAAHISLFVKPDVSRDALQKLADTLKQRADIRGVRIITPEQALEEFQQLSGFADAVKALDNNPLPAVVVVQPVSQADGQPTPALLSYLKQQPEIEIAQYDMKWLQRFQAMLELAQRGVLILAGILALTVLLIVGNTIRLSVNNRREEIEIYLLFGATNHYIRRPFLYSGFWYGVLGGLLAWGLVSIAFWLLQPPVKQLAALYNSQFELVLFNWQIALLLVSIGFLLGFGGAWLAVGRHLKGLQPL